MSYCVEAQTAADEAAIENLLDLSFGLSRRTKTSYRLREGSQPVAGLSLVVRDPALGLAGAISYWPLKIGEEGGDALLLGPLAVHPGRQNLGIGLALMKESLARAAAEGHALVILVGDEPYYARVGFARAPEGKFVLPGPVDPKRLLALEFKPGALAAVQGLVLSPSRFSGLHDTTSRPTP